MNCELLIQNSEFIIPEEWEKHSFYMAIVRTTRKETNTGATGTTPPAAKTKPVVKPAGGAALRGENRTMQNRASVSAKSGNAGRFINETTTELRRVVWPSREQVRAGTVVTVGLLVFFALYIYALDYIAHWLFAVLDFYPAPGQSPGQ